MKLFRTDPAVRGLSTYYQFEATIRENLYVLHDCYCWANVVLRHHVHGLSGLVVVPTKERALKIWWAQVLVI